MFPNIENTSTNIKNQDSSRFIPSKTFKNFDSVLNSIHQETGLFNKGEVSILKNLSFRAYKDGKIYPKQTTIAFDVGLTPNHVCYVLNGLKRKGFIEIEHATQGQKSQGRNNHYHFIMHPVYSNYQTHAEEIVSDIVTKKQITPIYILNNKTPLSGTIFYDKEQGKKDLENACQKIQKKCSHYHRAFNPYQFTQKYLKQYPAQAVKKTLEEIINKMEQCSDNNMFQAFDWWGYGTKIVKRIGGNMNEEQAIKEHERRKKDDFVLPGFVVGSKT